MSALLKVEDVTRTFPGVVALNNVSVTVRRGEVHALMGENGAGKSTLINLISGVLQPDHGRFWLDEQPVTFSNPVAARRLGVATVHQEAELFATLSVAENMALFDSLPCKRFGTVDWDSINRDAAATVAEIREPIDVRQPAERLSVAHRHMTQIASAIRRRARIIILDEPTSALSASEADWLFQQIERLKQAGAGIIYISHRHEEVFGLADRITVLRDGAKVWTRDRSEVDRDSLIAAMVGRTTTTESLHGKGASGATKSDCNRLQVRGLHDVAGRVRGIDFDVGRGEIVGMYGLIGAGRSETAQTVFGLRRAHSGTISVDGETCRIGRPADALAAGIAYVPEDRLRQGVFRHLSIRANTVITSLRTLARLLVLARTKSEQVATAEMTERLNVRHRHPSQAIGQLSGGNQQKVVVGRWLLTNPKVLILDEPTRGVDVASKAEIHRIVRGIANGGCSVLMISSELPEVLQNAHRVLVVRDGQVVKEFDPQTSSAEDVASAALPQDQDNSDSAAARPTQGRKRRARAELGLLAVVLLLVGWLAATTENFFSTANVAQLLADSALWTILALSSAAVIISGGIDISVGSLLALAAASAGRILTSNLPLELGIPLAIGAAFSVAIVGSLINAAASLWGRVHPIVVTLGMMIIYRGLVIAMLSGHQINNLPPVVGWLAIHPPSGFRASIVVGALVCLGMGWFLGMSRPGRHLYAYGSSPQASFQVGITQRRAWLSAFLVSGILIGIASLIELSSSMQMQSQLARGWELQAIAVAVIGGVRITGGAGSVTGVLLGAILLRLVNMALVRWEVQGEQINVVIGGMILAAVLIDLLWRKRGQ